MFFSVIYRTMFLFLATAAAASGDDTKETLTKYIDLGKMYFDDPPTAITHYEKGIALITDRDDLAQRMRLYVNCATLLSIKGESERALAYFKEALSLHDKSLVDGPFVKATVTPSTRYLACQAYFYLGKTYLDMALAVDGEEKNDSEYWGLAAKNYESAAVLDPGYWEALLNLGSIQDHMERYERSYDTFQRIFYLLDGNDPEGRQIEVRDPPEKETVDESISSVQYQLADLVRRMLKEKPDKKCDLEQKKVDCRELITWHLGYAVYKDENNEQAKQDLAALSIDASFARNAQIKTLKLNMDNIAENYERVYLRDLNYDGHLRLRRGLDQALGGPDKITQPFPVVVDAGCGTGLAGEQFRNVSTQLVCVELSQKMMDEMSRKRQELYDKAWEADMVEYFGEEDEAHIDLIVASDSFIHVGDLVPLFEAMAKGVVDGGLVAFTLENASEEDEKRLNDINPNWRWQFVEINFSHRKEYVESVARDHSFRVLLYENIDGYRTQGKASARGHLFVMKKDGPRDEL